MCFYCTQYVNKLFESDTFKVVVSSKFLKVLGINCKKIQLFVRTSMQSILGRSYSSSEYEVKSSVTYLCNQKGIRNYQIGLMYNWLKTPMILSLISVSCPFHMVCTPLEVWQYRNMQLATTLESGHTGRNRAGWFLPLEILLQGFFPTRGSNPGLLPCRQILYHLSHPVLVGKWLLIFWTSWSISGKLYILENMKIIISLIILKFC